MRNAKRTWLPDIADWMGIGIHRPCMREWNDADSMNIISELCHAERLF